jgi:hypothetical protein
VLPVSGVTLQVREATGADELLVLEPAGPPVVTVLALASRLATGSDGQAPDWEQLPAADAAAIALAIRRAWLGDTIRTEARCADASCAEWMDVAFGIPSYLAHHRPRTLRGVTAGREKGWFELAGAQVSFRLPTISDLQTALTAGDPEACLRQRCLQPATVPARAARQVSRAMSALAPSLSGAITACCPSCGASSLLQFDPLTYALAELRAAASGLYEEVHLLASAFSWSERDILALPRSRRAMYAELIHRDRVAA